MFLLWLKYKHFKENKELEEAAPIKGVADQNVARRTPVGTPDTPGVGAPEGPEGKYTQRAAKKGSHSDASTTIQGLKSNTLPAILGLLGAAAGGAAGYVAMTTNTPPIDPAATKEEIWKTVSQSYVSILTSVLQYMVFNVSFGHPNYAELEQIP